jgi:hypothetical protein
VEKTPFEFVGRSFVISHWERPDGLQSLVFRKGDRWLSVPLTAWNGSTPKVGEKVIIGQSGHGDRFFPVKLAEVYQAPDLLKKQIRDTDTAQK